MKILAIGSHADDIELGCGGTLARAVSQGHEVLMLVLSDKPVVTYAGKTIRTTKVTRKEGYAAAKFIGARLEFLHLDQKDVGFDSTTIEPLNRILDQFKPDHIFTQWVFDTHQAHHNTALSTIAAARNFPSIMFYEPFPPSGRSYMAFKPQVYVDISNVIETKAAAIEAHKSQVQKYGPEWVESVVGRAKLRGWDSGFRYAECFELLRTELKL